MLVVRSPALQPLAAILPERESDGLFIVSRAAEDGTNVWLVSDYASYAGEAQGAVTKWSWIKACKSRLEEVAPVAVAEPAVWAIYEAPKTEVDQARGQLKGHVLRTFGIENLLDASPTKLTLAPLLGESASSRIRELLSSSASLRRPREDISPYSNRDELDIAPERWESCTFTRPTDLLEGIAREARKVQKRRAGSKSRRPTPRPGRRSPRDSQGLMQSEPRAGSADLIALENPSRQST
jgi:hypothetical protein